MTLRRTLTAIALSITAVGGFITGQIVNLDNTATVSESTQIDALRSTHGDIEIACRGIGQVYTCAPAVSSTASRFVTLEEDGSVRYADGSVYDPVSATWGVTALDTSGSVVYCAFKSTEDECGA